MATGKFSSYLGSISLVQNQAAKGLLRVKLGHSARLCESPLIAPLQTFSVVPQHAIS